MAVYFITGVLFRDFSVTQNIGRIPAFPSLLEQRLKMGRTIPQLLICAS
jgi:hypothetical protein